MTLAIAPTDITLVEVLRLRKQLEMRTAELSMMRSERDVWRRLALARGVSLDESLVRMAADSLRQRDKAQRRASEQKARAEHWKHRALNG